MEDRRFGVLPELSRHELGLWFIGPLKTVASLVCLTQTVVRQGQEEQVAGRGPAVIRLHALRQTIDGLLVTAGAGQRGPQEMEAQVF